MQESSPDQALFESLLVVSSSPCFMRRCVVSLHELGTHTSEEQEETKRCFSRRGPTQCRLGKSAGCAGTKERGVLYLVDAGSLFTVAWSGDVEATEKEEGWK